MWGSQETVIEKKKINNLSGKQEKINNNKKENKLEKNMTKKKSAG